MQADLVRWWLCVIIARLSIPATAMTKKENLTAMDIPAKDPAAMVPIVYVYTLTTKTCEKGAGIGHYLMYSFNQAVASQGSNVYLVTNLEECEEEFDAYKGRKRPGPIRDFDFPDELTVIMVRTRKGSHEPTRSETTARFLNGSTISDSLESLGDLWLTSLTRFYFLADVMAAKGWDRTLHVEGDNLLYGPPLETTGVFEALSEEYPRLAFTPQNKLFTTAGVMWVGSRAAIEDMNKKFLAIALDPSELRAKIFGETYPDFGLGGCCKTIAGGGWGPMTDMTPSMEEVIRNSVDKDDPKKLQKVLERFKKEKKDLESNWGLKPAMLNEMYLLSHFRTLYGPKEFGFLPSLPPGVPTHSISHHYGTGGIETASASAKEKLGHSFQDVSLRVGIWDSGPWGQYIDGPPNYPGTHFINTKSYIGFAIGGFKFCRRKLQGRTDQICQEKKKNTFCKNGNFVHTCCIALLPGPHKVQQTTTPEDKCYLMPHLNCGQMPGRWYPLQNLHVHSKRTELFVSGQVPCSVAAYGNVSNANLSLGI